jgi:hypothetical protein
MSNKRISLIHATFNSYGISKRVRNFWISQADNPDQVEHCFAYQSDDQGVLDEYGITGKNYGITSDGKSRFIATVREHSPSAVRNWNAAASISSGTILLGIADDLVPNKHWDTHLWSKVDSHCLDEVFWKLGDGRCGQKKSHRFDEILPRHPAMTRALYEKLGYFFNPKFVSVGCDDDLLIMGLKTGVIRDAREIKFHHAIGLIFDTEGNLACGCFQDVGNRVRSASQTSIHENTWVSMAQSILNDHGKSWRALAEVSSTPQIGSFLINLPIQSKDESFGLPTLFMKVAITRKVNLHNKLKFAQKFLVRLFAIIIAQK